MCTWLADQDGWTKNPDLARIEAIQSQISEFERLRNLFAERLRKHLVQLLRQTKETEPEASGKPRLVVHETVYACLRPYSKLVHWLQRNRESEADQVRRVYASVSQQIYRYGGATAESQMRG